jgi:hypothetical protein
MDTIPTTYPNPRNDDPWDNDAIYWLLEQAGGSARSRHDLAECLRHQPARLRNESDKVARAESFASRHGVRWVEEPFGRRTIFRLYRTDPAAPEYPRSPEARNEIMREWEP